MTIKVDLLPTERKRFTFDPMMGFLMVIIILCTVGFVLYGSKLQNDIEAEKRVVSDIENQIKTIEQNLPVIEDLKTQIAKLEDEIKVIESLVYDPVRYGNLLTEVGRVLPENVWLSTLAIEPGTQSITMNGTAAQMGGRQPLATVAALMGRIDESEVFTDASLSATSQTQIAPSNMLGFTFQIETHYNPDVAAGLSENKAPAAGGTTEAPAPAEQPAAEASPAAKASPASGSSAEAESASPEAAPAGGGSPAPGATPGT